MSNAIQFVTLVDSDKLDGDMSAAVSEVWQTFKDSEGLSGNITLIATLATSVSMSARRSMPGTDRGRDRRLPSAGGK